MTYPSSPLISTEQLAAHLGDENLRIIDASWHLPTSNRDAKAEYLSSHIKGAVHFDLEQIANQTIDLPHMVAKANDFANAVSKLGISEKNNIVIYDSVGIFSAARVWWNFRIMGAKNVFVLNGGLPKWTKSGFEVTDSFSNSKKAKFTCSAKAENIFSATKILSLIENDFPNGEQIIDVRARDRFLGKVAEPRAGLRSGHIPNSKNLPFSELVKDGLLISPQEIEQKLL